MSTRASLCAGLLLWGMCLVLLGCAETSLPTESTPDDSIASSVPGTELFLAPMDTTGSLLDVGAPERLTRRPGYDNQPAFTVEGTALLWTSIRDGQADIYRRDLADTSDEEDATSRLSHTPTSEFSPTPLEEGGMSVIRVEGDGRQRLWRYTAQGTPVDPILSEEDSVGYHAWLDRNRVVLYILGTPSTLHVRNLLTGTDTTVASNIGRSLQPVPGRTAVSFIQIDEDSTTAVHVLEGESLQTEPLTPTPGDETGDDHAWSPDGTLLMAHDRTLQAWTANADEWSTVSSFDTLDVSRLAVSPTADRLALVADE